MPKKTYIIASVVNSVNRIPKKGPSIDRLLELQQAKADEPIQKSAIPNEVSPKPHQPIIYGKREASADVGKFYRDSTARRTTGQHRGRGYKSRR